MLLRDDIESEIVDKEAFISNTVKQIKELHRNFNNQVVIKTILTKAA